MKSIFYNSNHFDPYFGPLSVDFTAKLTELIQQNHKILWVAFQHDGSKWQQSPGSKRWVIVTDQQLYTQGIPAACVAKLHEFQVIGHKILCVAFTIPTSSSPSGWSITTDQGFYNSPAIPLDCHQKMKEFHDDNQKILCVAFTGPENIFLQTANRWSIITDKTFFNGPGVPVHCQNRMQELVAQGHELRVIAFSQSEFWADSVFSIITDKGFYNTEVTPGWVINERMLAFGECGWSVRTIAFAPELLLDFGGWGFSMIGDTPEIPVPRRSPPLVNVTGTAIIPANPPVPLAYNLQLAVKNLQSSLVTVDMALFGATTGGWVEWTTDPFAEQGIFAGQSQQIGPAQTVSGNGMGPATAETGFVVIRTASETSGEEKQLRHVKVPILRTGFATPPDIQAEPPVFIGLWTKPAEVVTVWRNGDAQTPVPWLTLSGQLVNTSAENAAVTDVFLEIKTGNNTILQSTAPAYAWTFYTFNGIPPAFMPITTVEKNGVIISPGISYFIHGIPLPLNFDSGMLTMTVQFRHGRRCQQATWNGAVSLVRPVLLQPPVVGTWLWGNAPDHTGWDAHTWPGHRYSWDLVINENGQSFQGSPDKAKLDNSRFYCWDQPIFCVADGIVYQAEDKFADHLAWLAEPPPESNFIIVQHALNRFTGYFHLKQGSLPVIGGKKLGPGDPVNVGDLLGRVGNSGSSSEPHLHFGVSEIDKTGRLHLLPAQFEGLKTEQNLSVNAVPGNGIYVS
jgi:hypothetical protein